MRKADAKDSDQQNQNPRGENQSQVQFHDVKQPVDDVLSLAEQTQKDPRVTFGQDHVGQADGCLGAGWLRDGECCIAKCWQVMRSIAHNRHGVVSFSHCSDEVARLAGGEAAEEHVVVGHLGPVALGDLFQILAGYGALAFDLFDFVCGHPAGPEQAEYRFDVATERFHADSGFTILADQVGGVHVWII